MFNPIGYKTMSNSHGIEVMFDSTESMVLYKYTNDAQVFESEIQFDQDGDPYFREEENNTIHYLNEFLKISWFQSK